MKKCNALDLEAGDFIHILGDAHLYSNHLNQAVTQLKRKPYDLPQMIIKGEASDIFSFKYDDFELVGYKSHKHIKAPIAV